MQIIRKYIKILKLHFLLPSTMLFSKNYQLQLA
jgi:hypothetical protein